MKVYSRRQGIFISPERKPLPVSSQSPRPLPSPAPGNQDPLWVPVALPFLDMSWVLGVDSHGAVLCRAGGLGAARLQQASLRFRPLCWAGSFWSTASSLPPPPSLPLRRWTEPSGACQATASQAGHSPRGEECPIFHLPPPTASQLCMLSDFQHPADDDSLWVGSALAGWAQRCLSEKRAETPPPSWRGDPQLGLLLVPC